MVDLDEDVVEANIKHSVELMASKVKEIEDLVSLNWEIVDDLMERQIVNEIGKTIFRDEIEHLSEVIQLSYVN